MKDADTLRLGVIFPQMEIGPDPLFVREYSLAVEAAGFRHLVAYDHVLGHQPSDPAQWSKIGPYTTKQQFHEVFTLFAFLAGFTTTIEFATGVLVLPQRQTALVAKQAAEVDILSGGRLRLGVGVGWNPVEYQALAVSFADRGRRITEQIGLLRKFWVEDAVTFEGEYHQIPSAGLNPRPTRAKIPIWMGGYIETVLRRAARYSDGLFLDFELDAASGVIARVHGYLKEYGRDPKNFGIEAQVRSTDVSQACMEGKRWRDLGVTHLSLNTMGLGLSKPTDHLDLALRFKQAWDSGID